MSYYSATGDGVFFQGNPFAKSFLTLYIEELPTFLLALGSVFPGLRTDMGFGITFFLFRVCYHGYMGCLSYKSNVDTPVVVLYALTFLLHCFWFYSWVSKYGSKSSSKQTKPIKSE